MTVAYRLDHRKYPTSRQVTDDEVKLLNIERAPFHGDWNYTVRPRFV
jgi:hypothetical protein